MWLWMWTWMGLTKRSEASGNCSPPNERICEPTQSLNYTTCQRSSLCVRISAYLLPPTAPITY